MSINLVRLFLSGNGLFLYENFPMAIRNFRMATRLSFVADESKIDG